jgi:outer membrane protein
MYKKLLFLVILIIVVFCLQSTAFSAEDSSIGLGVLLAESPYIGVENDTYPVPIINLEYKNLFIDKDIFGYHLFKGDALYLSIIGAPRFAGYDSGDSSALSGMQDRDSSLDAGFRLQLKGKITTFNLICVNDLLDEHQGQEISADLSMKMFDGLLMPRVGIRWLSDDLVDYYYGVKGSEATATRPTYQPGSTVNYVVGLTIGVPLAESWTLVGDIQYEVFGSEIDDSPIVDEDGVFRYTAGIIYSF